MMANVRKNIQNNSNQPSSIMNFKQRGSQLQSTNKECSGMKLIQTTIKTPDLKHFAYQAKKSIASLHMKTDDETESMVSSTQDEVMTNSHVSNNIMRTLPSYSIEKEGTCELKKSYSFLCENMATSNRPNGNETKFLSQSEVGLNLKRTQQMNSQVKNIADSTECRQSNTEIPSRKSYLQTILQKPCRNTSMSQKLPLQEQTVKNFNIEIEKRKLQNHQYELESNFSPMLSQPTNRGHIFRRDIPTQCQRDSELSTTDVQKGHKTSNFGSVESFYIDCQRNFSQLNPPNMHKTTNINAAFSVTENEKEEDDVQFCFSLNKSELEITKTHSYTNPFSQNHNVSSGQFYENELEQNQDTKFVLNDSEIDWYPNEESLNYETYSKFPYDEEHVPVKNLMPVEPVKFYDCLETSNGNTSLDVNENAIEEDFCDSSSFHYNDINYENFTITCTPNQKRKIEISLCKNHSRQKSKEFKNYHLKMNNDCDHSSAIRDYQPLLEKTENIPFNKYSNSYITNKGLFLQTSPKEVINENYGNQIEHTAKMLEDRTFLQVLTPQQTNIPKNSKYQMTIGKGQNIEKALNKQSSYKTVSQSITNTSYLNNVLQSQVNGMNEACKYTTGNGFVNKINYEIKDEKDACFHKTFFNTKNIYNMVSGFQKFPHNKPETDSGNIIVGSINIHSDEEMNHSNEPEFLSYNSEPDVFEASSFENNHLSDKENEEIQFPEDNGLNLSLKTESLSGKLEKVKSINMDDNTLCPLKPIVVYEILHHQKDCNEKPKPLKPLFCKLEELNENNAKSAVEQATEEGNLKKIIQHGKEEASMEELFKSRESSKSEKTPKHLQEVVHKKPATEFSKPCNKQALCLDSTTLAKNEEAKVFRIEKKCLILGLQSTSSEKVNSFPQFIKQCSEKNVKKVNPLPENSFKDNGQLSQEKSVSIPNSFIDLAKEASDSKKSFHDCEKFEKWNINNQVEEHKTQDSIAFQEDSTCVKDNLESNFLTKIKSLTQNDTPLKEVATSTNNENVSIALKPAATKSSAPISSKCDKMDEFTSTSNMKFSFQNIGAAISLPENNKSLMLLPHQRSICKNTQQHSSEDWEANLVKTFIMKDVKPSSSDRIVKSISNLKNVKPIVENTFDEPSVKNSIEQLLTGNYSTKTVFQSPPAKCFKYDSDLCVKELPESGNKSQLSTNKYPTYQSDFSELLVKSHAHLQPSLDKNKTCKSVYTTNNNMNAVHLKPLMNTKDVKNDTDQDFNNDLYKYMTQIDENLEHEQYSSPILEENQIIRAINPSLERKDSLENMIINENEEEISLNLESARLLQNNLRSQNLISSKILPSMYSLQPSDDYLANRATFMSLPSNLNALDYIRLTLSGANSNSTNGNSK